MQSVKESGTQYQWAWRTHEPIEAKPSVEIHHARNWKLDYSRSGIG